MSLSLIKFPQFLIIKLGKSISDFLEHQEDIRRTKEQNMRSFIYTYGYGDSTKLGIILYSLFGELFLGNRPHEVPKKVEKLSQKYYKISKSAYTVVYDNWTSKDFDAKKIISIIIYLLSLKKDELDKIDGGLPIT